MILTQPQELRRGRLAYLAFLRRLRPYSLRMAYTRGALVLVAVVIDLSSKHALIACLLTLPAVVGTSLSYLAAIAPGIESNQPLLRIYEEHLARTDGYPRLNLPAIVELWGSILLIVAAAWAVVDLPGSVRLAYLATATLFICNVSCAIFDDHAWYNPAVRSPRWQEIDRVLSGPQMGLLVLGIAVWAPWTSTERVGVLILACWSFLVPLRITSTQHLTRNLEPLVEEERQFGTRFVIEQTTESLLPPLTEALRLARGQGTCGEPLTTLISSAIDGIIDIPNQVAHSARVVDGDPLRTVADRLASLAASAGRSIDIVMPSALALAAPDRTLASLAMRDLVGNAITAGAGEIVLTVRVLGPRLMVIVTDDGRAMPEGAWKSAGTSSASLERRLLDRRGSLSLDSAGDAKTVTATWVAVL
jgi:signal transduction histidine kinase